MRALSRREEIFARVSERRLDWLAPIGYIGSTASGAQIVHQRKACRSCDNGEISISHP
jgi:hypothetical protein